MESLMQAPLCSAHERPIEYFCTIDQVQICSRCYIMGDHKDHNIISFEEKNKLAISSLENGLETATIVYNKLSKVEKLALSKKLRVEKMSLVENVNKSFTQLSKIVKQRERAVLGEITKIYDSYLNVVELNVQHAKNEKQKLEKSLINAQSLLQNQTMVIDGEQLLDTINAASQIPCMISQKLSLLEWDKTHIEDIIEAISVFGTIKDKEKEPTIFLKTVDEEPANATAEEKVFRLPIVRQRSYDAPSISSVDTGEDVIIESDTDSVVSSSCSIATSNSKSNKSVSSSSRELIYPRVKSPLKQCTVTHIRTPHDFFVQLNLNRPKLEIMSRNINSWCRRKSNAKRVPSYVEKGMKLLACYSADNQWYRAEVLNVDMAEEKGDEEIKVHVLYYDFGNEERLSMKNLREMENRFKLYPSFCIQCTLHDVTSYLDGKQWDLATVQEFFKMTHNQSLLLNVLSVKGNLYDVDLLCLPTADVLDDKVSSVRDMLVFLGLAKFAGPSESLASTIKPEFRIKGVQYFKPTALNTGESVDMVVTEATSPSDFYMMCYGDEHDYYLNMMEEMKDVYSNDQQGIYNMHCPRCGDLCVVQGADGAWYRGEIVSDPKVSKVTVYLTDTGATLVVHRDQIRKLLSNFIKLASQAVRCKLADIGFVDESVTDWSNDAKQWCLSDMKGSKGTVRIVRWGPHTEVVLWIGVNKPSVNSLLVEAGLASSTGLASTAVISQGHVTPSNVGSNKASKKESHSKSPVPSSPKHKGTATKKTNSISSPTVSSSNSVCDEAVSPRDKRKKDKKSHKRSLKKEVEDSSSSETVVDFAQAEELARKKKVQDNIHKAMETSSEERAAAKKSGDSTYVEIIVSYYKSPVDFYIRIQEKESALQELMHELNVEYRDSLPLPEHEWKVDDFCVVRYPEDGLWYRGKVISSMSATDVQVELLDWGNSFRVSTLELRPLVRDLGTRLHRAAVRCRLADLIPSGTSDPTKWSRTAIDYVTLHVKAHKLYIKTLDDPSDQGLPIDIIVEEEIPESAFDPVTFTYYSMRQKLVDEGLAYFDRKRKEKKKSECEGEKQSEPIPQEPVVTDVPPYTLPELNSVVSVLPTFIDYDGVIYAQHVDWNDEVMHLSAELQRVYKDSPQCEREWRAGDYCVALFKSDGLWYRGLIEAMDGQLVKVFYIDYGNSSWMKSDDLRELRAPFGDYHVQVYHCVLDNILPNSSTGQWAETVLDLMHELVVNCLCTMVFTGTKDNGHLKIALHKSDDFELSSYLVTNEYAISTMDLKDRFIQSRTIGSVLTNCDLCNPPFLGGPGAVFNAEATELELPNIVYVQRTKMDDSNVVDFVQSSEVACVNKEIDDYDEMMEDIKTTPSSGFVKLPDVGTLCLGKYHFDRCWYRAICVEKYPEIDSCFVVFIDFGTPETVTRDCLRCLPTQFWNMPGRGIRCYLNLVPPGGEGAMWRKNSQDAMAKALGQKPLVVKVVQDKPLTVELFVETEHGLCLAYEDVVQKGLALLPTQVAMNALLPGKAADRMLEGEVEIEEVEEDGDGSNDNNNADGAFNDTSCLNDTDKGSSVNNIGADKTVLVDENRNDEIGEVSIVTVTAQSEFVDNVAAEEVDNDNDEDGWTTDSGDED